MRGTRRAFCHEDATRIILRLDQTNENWPHISDLQDGTQEILLGKPIVHVTHDDRAKNLDFTHLP